MDDTPITKDKLTRKKPNKFDCFFVSGETSDLKPKDPW
jgi:hypothetical protein